MAGKSSFTSYLSDPPDAGVLVNIDDSTGGGGMEAGTMTDHDNMDDPYPLVKLAESSSGVNGGGNGVREGGDSLHNPVSLCGYLNKYKVGARGLGKNFKRRWFVHSENACKLLYYRTPEDIVPLGEIDVCNASLSVQTGHETDDVITGRSNIFKISCDDKIYYLEAADQQTMMYWLQQLQRKRRAFSRKKTTLSTEKAQLKTLQEPSAGLVGGPVPSNLEASLEVAPLLQPVDRPSDTVGASSASTQSGKSLSNISISNWRIELRNVMSNIRQKRQSDSEMKRQSDSDMPVQSASCKPVSPSTSPDITVGSSDDLSQQKPSRFASLRRRLKARSFNEQDSESQRVSTDSFCNRCKSTEVLVQQQQEELTDMEEELEATRSVVRVLQKQLDTLHQQLKTREELEANPDPGHQSELLTQRDKTIVDLEHLLTTLNEEKQMQNVQNTMMESKLGGLQDEVEMYRESLKMKDESIMSLTNQLFDIEHRPVNSTGTNTTLKRKVCDMQEMERLRDVVSGYELQNKFLNKEILELNHLRNDDERREREVYMRCKEWEARYYQVHSKYLLTLEQLKLPVRGGDASSQEMVTQLLNDALDLEDSTEKKTDLLTSQSLDYSIGGISRRKYDKYGFVLGPMRTEDLVERATSSQLRSEEIRGQNVDKQVLHNVRWENYLITLGTREIQRSQELKTHIRAGIPYQYRERVWNACISMRVGKLRSQVGPHYYQNLLDKLEQSSHRYNPAVKQIDLDLLRTLPHNRHYQSLSSHGIPKLKRVLLAYTQHNPDLGYCQGQNRLAAIALLFLNEEDAFWCLVAITDSLMPPDYYSQTLIAAQVDQRVLKDLMTEKLPHVTSHLETLDVDVTLFTFNWFLTVFVDNIPTETFLRVWDVYLYEGNKVLFRYAMAFFKHREKDILSITDNMALHSYLRGMAERAVDVDCITQMAFHDMNPLPMRHIQARRQVHMLQVKAELDELDALRSEFRSSRKDTTRQVHDDISDDDM